MDRVAQAARSAALEGGICLGEWLPSPSTVPCETAFSDLPVGTVCRKAPWNLKFFGFFFFFNKKLDQGIPTQCRLFNARNPLVQLDQGIPGMSWINKSFSQIESSKCFSFHVKGKSPNYRKMCCPPIKVSVCVCVCSYVFAQKCGALIFSDHTDTHGLIELIISCAVFRALLPFLPTKYKENSKLLRGR